MARVDPEQGLLPSVLDRLIDRDPSVSSEPPASRARHLAQLKEAVQRDLEWLLNTKQTIADLPPNLRTLNTSLLTFGLPDFTASSLSSTDDRNHLRRALLESISRFEPRLRHVTVTLEEGRKFDRNLRFRIEGMLRVEPVPEPVAFDSVLQLHTKAFVVKGGSG